jgi:hypothetical protein
VLTERAAAFRVVGEQFFGLVKEKDMKKHLVAALAAVTLSSVPALAQGTSTSSAPAGAAAATVTPTVGAKVYDPQGGEVGAIEKVDGANAVVYTGTKRATLPVSAFAKNEKGLLISMSQAQLNAAVAAAEAQTTSAMDAKLVANAAIKSKDGASVGTVQKIEGDNVTIALAGGGPVTVTKQYLTIGADGNLELTMNAAEFKSAVAAASQSSTAAPTTAGATAGAAAQTSPKSGTAKRD